MKTVFTSISTPFVRLSVCLCVLKARQHSCRGRWSFPLEMLIHCQMKSFTLIECEVFEDFMNKSWVSFRLVDCEAKSDIRFMTNAKMFLWQNFNESNEMFSSMNHSTSTSGSLFWFSSRDKLLECYEMCFLEKPFQEASQLWMTQIFFGFEFWALQLLNSMPNPVKHWVLLLIFS